MTLGGRPFSKVLVSPVKWRHYRGLGQAFRRYASPGSELRRYLTGDGSYPHGCRIRTPLGVVAPTLYSPDDMITVHEIFCRRIYPVARGSQVIVDFGSNIGVSALFFLTEAPSAHCHLFEANPALIGRLRENLKGFEERVAVNEAAVAPVDGEVELGVEETGRYGGIGVTAPETITVQSEAAADALEAVLEADGEIDLLKLDVEGIEIDILRSLPARVLERIRRIHLETESPANPLPHGFEMSRIGGITTLVREDAEG